MATEHGALIFAVGMLIVALIVVGLVWTQNEQRAAQCPEGTLYARQLQMCVEGVRPWEVRP